jgi:protein-disulfide isomerase
MRKSTFAVVATLGFVAALILSASYEQPAQPAAQPRLAAVRSNDSPATFIKVDWVRLPSKKSERRDDDASDSPELETSRSGGGAQVTIVEFEDFQCPYCAEAESTIDQVREKYGDRVAIEHRDFPLPFHPNAMDAAMAARCADAQGQLEQYRAALYDNQSDLSRQALEDLARKTGINVREFDRCLDSERYQRDIEADVTAGKRSRIDGTPAFLINGRLYSGALSFEKFQSIIDADLAASAR